MQIGPSHSVLQALGSHPGAPEPVRLKPAADARATAQPVDAADLRTLPPVEAAAAPGRAERAEPGRPGARIDIRI